MQLEYSQQPTIIPSQMYKRIQAAILFVCLALLLVINLAANPLEPRLSSNYKDRNYNKSQMQKWADGKDESGWKQINSGNRNINGQEKEIKGMNINKYQQIKQIKKVRLTDQIQQNQFNQMRLLQKLQYQINVNGLFKQKLNHIVGIKYQLLTELKQLQNVFGGKFTKPFFQSQILDILKMSALFTRVKQIRYELSLLQQLIKQIRMKGQIQQKFTFYKYDYGSYPILNRMPLQNIQLSVPSKKIQQFQQRQDLIIYTPAGRKDYLQILYKYLLKQRNSFYKWHLWVNTRNPTDLQYITRLSQQNDWIRLIILSNYEYNFYDNFLKFWISDRQADKIYLRIDDDTVWISQNFIDKMYKARIQNPHPIFIFPNIINNQIIGYLHQRGGNLNLQPKFVMQYTASGNYWKIPKHVINVHEQFLQSVDKNETDKWKTSFTEWHLLNYQRVSINSMIYFGSDIDSILSFGFFKQEQQIFSSDVPHYYHRKSIIINDPICVHEAFGTQRYYLRSFHGGILQRYAKLIMS